MAKLEITLDTDANEMAVAVNGEAIANVRSVEVYNWGDVDGDGDMHFSVGTHETVDGVSRRVCLTASKRAGDEGVVTASRFPGLVEVRGNDAVSRAVAGLLGSWKRR